MTTLYSHICAPERAPAGMSIHNLLIAALLAVFAGCGESSQTTSNGPPGGGSTPALSVQDAAIAEGNSGASDLTFSISLSAVSTSPVTVNAATNGGTATAGDDFAATNESLTIAAGSTSASFTVTVNGDTTPEADETFTVTLSGATNATIARATATGTIADDDVSVVVGLDSRPDNQTCVAPPRPTSNATVAIVDPFPGLANISQPTKMILEPGVADPRWFVLQKSGQLVTFDPDDALDAGNVITADPFLDLSAVVRTASEGGLLGIAFHPNYPTTPEVFLSYTVNFTGPDMRSIVSRFVLDSITSPGGGTTEQVLLRVDQDFDNHNGGDIAFGADGFLYIGFGDGGSGDDPNNRAQNTQHLLGSMLRIDVLNAGAADYTIPADNPFAGNALCGPGINANDCPEIYAWGLRNPWRWSFDSANGELWVADVGQVAREEINRLELGGNYGWRCREGFLTGSNHTGCGTGCIAPVADYPRSVGSSITGGFVYRGSAIPELSGKYVFADYGSGRVMALQPDGQGGYDVDELTDSAFGPTSFGVGPDNELYFTDINNSRLRMLVPAGPGNPDTIPELLSATGCTDPADTTQPYSGLVPYDLNAPFWSDGANKGRFIGLPNGTTIVRDANDDWQFPEGTVIVKNFSLNGALVETRHLIRHPDGVWGGYTYEWNAQQTEATRVRGGKTVSVAGQTWIFPSEGQCLECHTSAAGFALGPETAQLNRDLTYPSTQRTANQLETLDHIMMFQAPLPGPAASLPAMTNPDDATATTADRARAYLHTNCSNCHQPNGPTPSDIDFRYSTALNATNVCDLPPLEGDLGIANARLVAPGEPSRSVVVERMARRDSHGMPPTATALVDTAGVSLITDWVNGLTSCN